MPNSLKSRLKKLKHQGLLSEKDLNRIIIIPDNATNGDMMKILFPDFEIRENKLSIAFWTLMSDGSYEYNSLPKEWWNAPYKLSELKGENNTSEQVEKKCENCKYWNGGYVTFVCCECKDKSEWREQTSKTTIKTSDGKEYDIENDCLIRKSEAIKQIYEKSLRIDNPDTQNGLAGAVAILSELKGENK